MDASLIVVHSISLPPGEFQGEHVQALFTNTLDWDAHPYFQQIRGLEVSAHFYVRRDGALWQFVGTGARAWHAGVSRHAGRENCNDFSVGIELEGLEGGPFEPAQYETLASLCAALAARHRIIRATRRAPEGWAGRRALFPTARQGNPRPRVMPRSRAHGARRAGKHAVMRLARPNRPASSMQQGLAVPLPATTRPAR